MSLPTLGIAWIVAAVVWSGEVWAQPLPLGNAELVAGPAACGQWDCYELEISCAQLAEPQRVFLKAKGPVGPERGTILFHSGGGGRTFWGAFGRHARRTMRKLRRGGFRTVQVRWVDGWLTGAQGGEEGQANLACRPSTVARWVYDELHVEGRGLSHETAFCATGNSGGAAQVSYMMSHYGLGEILSAIVPTGGPPMSRIDTGCLGVDTPGEFPVTYHAGSRDRIDSGFGYDRGEGPCAHAEVSFEDSFLEASIAAFGLDAYVFPETLVWFVFGEQDVGSARGQGLLFFDRLVEAGTPLVEQSIAANTPHATPSTKEGAEMILGVLLEGCRVWP